MTQLPNQKQLDRFRRWSRVLSEIARTTGRDDVAGSVRPAPRQWNYMILGQRALAALVAIHAAMIVGVLHCQPLRGGEVIDRSVSLSSAPSRRVGDNPMGIFRAVAALDGKRFLGVSSSPALRSQSAGGLGRRLVAPSLLRSAAFVAVRGGPLLTALQMAGLVLQVLPAIDFFSFIRIGTPPFSRIGCVLFSIGPTPLCYSELVARLASRFAMLPKDGVEAVSREDFVASGACVFVH